MTKKKKGNFHNKKVHDSLLAAEFVKKEFSRFICNCIFSINQKKQKQKKTFNL